VNVAEEMLGSLGEIDGGVERGDGGTDSRDGGIFAGEQGKYLHLLGGVIVFGHSSLLLSVDIVIQHKYTMDTFLCQHKNCEQKVTLLTKKCPASLCSRGGDYLTTVSDTRYVRSM